MHTVTTVTRKMTAKGSIDEFDWDSDELETMLLGEENDDKVDWNGFTHEGVGYGNVTEEVLERKKKVSKAEKKKIVRKRKRRKKSSQKDLGVRNLLFFVKNLAGPHGNVWVIGSQNAGKSTLINAFAKKEGAKVTKLTEAPVPGTTLGILRIGGVLSAKANMFDTPRLLHAYLLSMRLKREEQKMVEIRKELRPRSYRIKPPIGNDRGGELGTWQEKEVKVVGKRFGIWVDLSDIKSCNSL